MFLTRLLIIFLVLPLFVKAQYQSFFGLNSTNWNIKDHYMVGLRTDSLVSGPDTLIGATVYKKLFWYEAPGGALFHTSYIREEAANGLLWHKSAPDSLDILVVDMGLSLGDIFQYKDPLVGYVNFEVDSVYYVSGTKYIRLKLVANDLHHIWFIEGVGASVGIAYCENTTAVIDPYLLCQRKDNILTYQNNHPTFQGKCNVAITGVSAGGAKRKLQVYPNPTADYITVSKEAFLDCTVRLYDLYGKEVCSIRCPVGVDCTVSLKELPNGLYILQLQSNEQVFEMERIFRR